MSKIILFNKPYRVMSQFSPSGDKLTLAKFINLPEYYPAGRLDYESEGLLILTDDGQIQHYISHPSRKLPKVYFVQVEGEPKASHIVQLQRGVLLNDGLTKPAKVVRVDEPDWLWPRNPPIRTRMEIPVSWLKLTITEGRNRQVRRMTAHIGFPTLRLIRYAIGNWTIKDLQPGEYVFDQLHLPKQPRNNKDRVTKK